MHKWTLLHEEHFARGVTFASRLFCTEGQFLKKELFFDVSHQKHKKKSLQISNVNQ